MSETKIQNITENLAQNMGMLLMTAAVMFGTAEMAGKPEARAVMPNQPTLATVGDNTGGHDPISRERNETAPHFVSYSEIQRTPSRSGKQ